MRFLTTGFTTKTWDCIVGPNSRGIKDLSLVLPEALIEMEHEVLAFKDTEDITQEDVILVKLWDCFDQKYSQHTPDLIKKLSGFNVNKENIILVSDHHDVRPAIKSLEKLAKITYMGKKLLRLYEKGMVLENRFLLSPLNRDYNHLSLDPSPYVINDFHVAAKGQIDLDSKHWVHGSLTYTGGQRFDSALAIDYHTDLTSIELCKEIARNRLYIMPEHVHNLSDWWRPNYLMGFAGRAACYASPRDQMALFGTYFTMQFIERNLEAVQAWQNMQLAKKLQTKEGFKRILNLHLRQLLPHKY